MHIRVCSACGDDFDLLSQEKTRAGGLASHCPECSVETTVPYLGLQSGDGKASGVTVLAFESEADRKAYQKFWQNNTGYNKGKNCQLGTHLSTTPGAKFRKVAEAGLGMNHKGRKS